MKTKILIPIYNDWQSVFKLLENIDLQLDDLDAEVSVLIINDASTEKKVLENINKEMDNKTVISISHDKNSLKFCEKIFSVNKNEIKKIDI